ncbi:MAG: biopolymer transporter ExbD [Verrucomicrobiota bacterium]
MKRFSDRYKGDVLSDLNVTPLIDLAFTLLIIFMIATPLIEQRMEIQLPKASTEATSTTPEKIQEIAVDAQGNIFYAEQLMTVKELETALQNLKSTDSNAAVSLRADADLRYQILVQVLDVIKKSEVKLGLATLPENK